MTFAERLIAYAEEKRYLLFKNPGEVNIFYVEGCDANGRKNLDEFDRWNDRRIVLHFKNGRPEILINVTATTEPGRKSTNSRLALFLGGVFRVEFGQWVECWQTGFHKGRLDHPALVQIPGREIWGYRDLDRNGVRTGDARALGYGINQHGTAPGFRGLFVGDYSAGCQVGRGWADHKIFMNLLLGDPRRQRAKDFPFSTAIIAGDDLQKLVPA